MGKTASIKNKFKIRAVTSVSLLIVFVVLCISGVVLPGDSLSTEPRSAWSVMHEVAGRLFCLFGLIHIAYNRKAILHYLRRESW